MWVRRGGVFSAKEGLEVESTLIFHIFSKVLDPLLHCTFIEMPFAFRKLEKNSVLLLDPCPSPMS
jgi:hypothetical protein